MTQPAVLRALLVDDEPRAREILRYYLSKVGGVEVVGEAGDGAEAARLAEELRPDVVFLDVHMPEVDGLEAVKLLRREGAGLPLIVFITAYEQHAVAAFAAEAVDYVVKPLTVSRMWQTVERLQRRVAAFRTLPAAPAAGHAAPAVAAAAPASLSPAASGRPRRIPLAVGGDERVQRTLFLEPGAILAVEAQGKTCTVWTRQSRLPVLHSLSAMEELLPRSLFFRTHRSYLVNLRVVSELFADGRTYGLRLEGCSGQVPVSRDKVAALRAALGLLP